MGFKQIIIGLLKLFTSKESFAKYATDEGTKHEWKNSEYLQETNPEGIVPDGVYQQYYGYNLDRAKALRKSLFTSAAITIFSVVLGTLSGYILKCYVTTPSTILINALQIVGAGILLCATISVLSHEIESSGKNTLAEKINRALFKALYVIGSFLLFLAMSWNT